MIVMKFGGTSVEDVAAIDRVCSIVRGQLPRRPVVVVSAMAGVTNGLLQAAEHCSAGRVEEAIRLAEDIERRHVALLADTAAWCARLKDLLRAMAALGEVTPRTTDHLASYGEVLSSLVVTERMQLAGIDAAHVDSRRCVVTDQNFTRAAPLLKETGERLTAIVKPLIDQGRVVVMGGYIGATVAGVTTTLGRGGSDYSASVVGAGLGADEIQIWTDVDGMMTADPRVVPDAHRVQQISFAEAAELAYFGAKVLHPLTVMPAVEADIPVYIYNSRKPASRGTRIENTSRACRNVLKSIACKKGITAVTITSSRMLMAYGFLSALFRVFEKHRTPVDMVTTSEVSVSLTLDDTKALDAIVADLREVGEVRVDTDMALICVVGSDLKYTAGVAHRVFGSLKDINVLMVSHGASNINLSFLVEQKHADTAVRRLHAEFFSEFDPEVFEAAGEPADQWTGDQAERRAQ